MAVDRDVESGGVVVFWEGNQGRRKHAALNVG